MLTDHSRQAAHVAEQAQWRRQAQQALGDFIDNLDYWDWIGTITFRHAAASERAFALVKDWLSRVEKSARGRRITSAIAVSRGEYGGRVHVHFLVAGVDDLDMEEWERYAIGLFGDCKIELFDPEKGGCHYFAKNALAEHGDYQLFGKAIEDRIIAAEEEDVLADRGNYRLGHKTIEGRMAADEENDAEIVPPNPKLRPGLDNPRRQPPSNQQTQPVTVKGAAVYVRTGVEVKAEDIILHQRIQARPIQRFIRERGWAFLRVYRDVASAKTGKRWSQFHTLMAAVKRGEVDVVIVSRFDRIARNTREALSVLAAGRGFCLPGRWLRHHPPAGSCIVHRGDHLGQDGARAKKRTLRSWSGKREATRNENRKSDRKAASGGGYGQNSQVQAQRLGLR